MANIRTVKALRVDQLLHGYSDGHKLIVGSVDLPVEARRTTLVMSDLSGPSMVDGFSSYLTAYPLTSSQMFAIARTWYAPELPRPGCVWTHTLLFQIKDIANICEWHHVEALFERPKTDGDCEEFKGSILLEQVGNDSGRSHFDSVPVGPLLQALYGQPEQPVVVLANDSKHFESLVIDIWLEQWPELRANFAFCTGALGARKINSRFFDLQVSPYNSIRQLKRDMPNAAVVDMPNAATSASKHYRWLDLATDDIIRGELSDFRSFTREFGSLAPSGRESFRILAELFAMRNFAVHSQNGVDGLIPQIIRVCEQEDDWSMVSFLMDNPKILMGFGAQDATTSRIILAVSKGNITLPAELDKIVPRIVESLRNEGPCVPLRLAAELVTTSLNHFGETMLNAIVDSSNPQEILKSIPNSKQLLYGMVRRKPEFAVSQDLWRLASSAQGDLVDAIVAARPTAPILRDIIQAMLQAGAEPWSVKLFELDSATVIGAALDFFARRPGANLEIGPAWRRGFGKNQEAVMSWVEAHHQSPLPMLATVIQFINPDFATKSTQHLGIWTDINHRLQKEPSASEFLALRSFLIAIAFSYNSSKLLPLVEDNFRVIHDALAQGKLDSRMWDVVEMHLPSVGFWWDRCERLRRGVIGLMVQNGGNLTNILRSVDEDTLEFLAKSCLSTDDGIALLRRSIRAEQLRILPISIRRTLRDSRL